MFTDFQANVSLWQECNLKCAYCFARPIAPPREWSPEIDVRLDQMARFLNATGTWTLEISGGEPTIHPGFAAWCIHLAAHGHDVQFFTNGVEPLWDVFPDGDVSSVSRVVLSYHPTHDRHPKHHQMFLDNVTFLVERDVDVSVNYVMYPGRTSTPEQIREAFERPGVEIGFRAFQGEADGREYPGAYTDDEMTEFETLGDIQARYLMEHGFYQPTGKLCRAGSETFYIAMRTGGVYTCEQLQARPLARFTDADGPEQFRQAVAPTPQRCPATRCTCRLTVDQESFLATNDRWDMANYPAFAELSDPSEEALRGIQQSIEAFGAELAGRMEGDAVVVWAAGVHTVVLLRRLADAGFSMDRIVGIVDSERFKQGKEVHGHTVLSPAQFEERWGDRCTDILVSSRAFESEIAARLNDEYGERFNLVRLYDGTFAAPYEFVADGVIADLRADDVDVSAPTCGAGGSRPASGSSGPVTVELGRRR